MTRINGQQPSAQQGGALLQEDPVAIRQWLIAVSAVTHANDATLVVLFAFGRAGGAPVPGVRMAKLANYIAKSVQCKLVSYPAKLARFCNFTEPSLQEMI